LPFKCNLQRYIVEEGVLGDISYSGTDEGTDCGDTAVGRCRLNQVDT
jgi:hypothetical protein